MMPRTGPSKGDYRMDKVHGYLEIARAVAMRSTCLNKKYGAIVVKDDEIVSTGYNGAPRGIDRLYRPRRMPQDQVQHPQRDELPLLLLCSC